MSMPYSPWFAEHLLLSERLKAGAERWMARDERGDTGVSSNVPDNAGTRYSPDEMSFAVAANQALLSLSSFFVMAVDQVSSSNVLA